MERTKSRSKPDIHVVILLHNKPFNRRSSVDRSTLCYDHFAGLQPNRPPRETSAPDTFTKTFGIVICLSLSLSLSLSKTNKKVQFLLEERHGLLREDPLLVLLIFISWHKIFQFAESLKNTNRERSE